MKLGLSWDLRSPERKLLPAKGRVAAPTHGFKPSLLGLCKEREKVIVVVLQIVEWVGSVA